LVPGVGAVSLLPDADRAFAAERDVQAASCATTTR
jgi:hypothetical protein